MSESKKEESLIKFRKITATALFLSQVVLIVAYAALTKYGDVTVHRYTRVYFFECDGYPGTPGVIF